MHCKARLLPSVESACFMSRSVLSFTNAFLAVLMLHKILSLDWMFSLKKRRAKVQSHFPVTRPFAHFCTAGYQGNWGFSSGILALVSHLPPSHESCLRPQTQDFELVTSRHSSGFCSHCLFIHVLWSHNVGPREDPSSPSSALKPRTGDVKCVGEGKAHPLHFFHLQFSPQFPLISGFCTARPYITWPFWSHPFPFSYPLFCPSHTETTITFLP